MDTIDIRSLTASDKVSKLVRSDMIYFNFVFDSICKFDEFNYGIVPFNPFIFNDESYAIGLYSYPEDGNLSIAIVKDDSKGSINISLSREMFIEILSMTDTQRYFGR